MGMERFCEQHGQLRLAMTLGWYWTAMETVQSTMGQNYLGMRLPNRQSRRVN